MKVIIDNAFVCVCVCVLNSNFKVFGGQCPKRSLKKRIRSLMSFLLYGKKISEEFLHELEEG